MRKLAWQAARFAVAGVLGLLADVAVLYLTLACGSGLYLGRALSFLTAVWVTWTFNRRYTFQSAGDESAWRQWWRYLGAMAGGGAVNYFAYGLTLQFAPAGPLLPAIAVAIGSLAGMTVNFVSAKFFVFKS